MKKRALFGLAIVAGVVLAALAAPDVKRYLRLRSM